MGDEQLQTGIDAQAATGQHDDRIDGHPTRGEEHGHDSGCRWYGNQADGIYHFRVL